MTVSFNMAGVRRIKPEVEAAILREYSSGVSAGKLGVIYGINRKTVTTIVRRNGGQVLDQRSASGRPPLDPNSYVARVVELRVTGLSQSEIGKRLGLCQSTISKVLIKAGLPTRNILQRERHGSWKGGKSITGYGYLAVRVEESFPFPEMVSRAGYVLQHRLVMALHIGRPLSADETVHHINANKLDNRIENLQLRQGKHGKGACLQCADCGSFNVLHTKIK